MIFENEGAELFYEVRGNGPPVVLLHPFPANHHFWDGCIPYLEDRYRLILPDLRAHGDSSPGTGAATMEKHARDVAALCDHLQIEKALFVGVSIGGYVLFEFWRQSRERVTALVLADTRAEADSDDARQGREKSIQQVQERGPGPLIDAMIPKLLGESTLRNRPDIVDSARTMMSRMTVPGLVAALQGLAARPDSVPTLKSIRVPVLMVFGEEDVLTPRSAAEPMVRQIIRSRLEIVPRAGHYAAFEQPELFGTLLRTWLDGMAL